MAPKKKRVRYIGVARKLAEKHGLKFDPSDWNLIWEILDKYGEASFVYAIVDSNSSLVKFGKSVNPGQRLAALQTSHGKRLTLWGFCEESVELSEKSVHRELAAHRVGGEWFELNQTTRAVIDRLRETSGVN